MARIRIHRGFHQIGGSITEIYTDNTHIFIDFGSELNAETGKSTDGSMVDMMKNAKCDAVLFTHYHGDHVGLIDKLPERDVDGTIIKIGMGVTARKVLDTIHKTLLGFDDISEDERAFHEDYRRILNDDRRKLDIIDGQEFEIGDFLITPVMVDHSAYDAYLFVIESKVDHKVIVHTGDFRTHGRLGADLFDKVKRAIGGRTVDVLITEGTMMSRLDEEVKTETEMQAEAYDLLKKPENKYAFLICSSTNMESLASFANAAQAVKDKAGKGRKFYVNSYVLEQIKLYRESAGKDKKTGELNWDFTFVNANALEGMKFWNPKLGMTQMEYMEKHGFVMLIGTSEGYMNRIKYFKDRGYDPLLIYSMWDGYVNKEKYPSTYDEKLGGLYHGWNEGRVSDLHTSGHATAEDIRKMILIVNPTKHIIPIHTENASMFHKLNIGELEKLVCDREDGDSFEI